jgi:uncharacterized protein YkwD
MRRPADKAGDKVLAGSRPSEPRRRSRQAPRLRRGSAGMAVLACPMLIGSVLPSAPVHSRALPSAVASFLGSPQGAALSSAHDGRASSSAPCQHRPRHRTGNTRTIERSFLCLLNSERVRRHLKPLHRNAALDKAARWQSRDMVAHAYFDHVRRGGPNFVQRIRRTGYLSRARRWLVGENIAWGEGHRSTTANIVKAWMASPGHRENILDSTYEDVGIGLVLGSPYDRDADSSTPSGRRAVTITTDFGFRVDAAR